MNWFNKKIDSIDKAYHQYRKLLKVIDRYATTKSVIKSVLAALATSLLIVLIPILVIVNMFIFSKLTLILSILLLVILVSWGMLYFHLYYQMLVNYHPELEDVNTTLPARVEGSMISIALFMIGTIIIAIIF